MSNTVSAIEARRNLGEILDRAYYKGEETVVERKGKVIARIVPVARKTNLKSLLSFAGVLSKEDAAIIKKSTSLVREESERAIKKL